MIGADRLLIAALAALAYAQAVPGPDIVDLLMRGGATGLLVAALWAYYTERIMSRASHDREMARVDADHMREMARSDEREKALREELKRFQDIAMEQAAAFHEAVQHAQALQGATLGQR